MLKAWIKVIFLVNEKNDGIMEASAKEGEGAGRGPCGLRNSELGPLPHTFDDFIYGLTVWQDKKISIFAQIAGVSRIFGWFAVRKFRILWGTCIEEYCVF